LTVIEVGKVSFEIMHLGFKVVKRCLDLDTSLVKDCSFVQRICVIAFNYHVVYEIKIQTYLKNILNIFYQFKNDYKDIILEHSLFFNLTKI